LRNYVLKTQFVDREMTKNKNKDEQKKRQNVMEKISLTFVTCAPPDKCAPLCSKTRQLHIKSAISIYVFVSAPDGSHSAPIAKCTHLCSETR